VKGADLKDGLLHIDLVRNVPERLKARTISIGADKAPAQVEAVA
jgi:molecular chaperone IbpA